MDKNDDVREVFPNPEAERKESHSINLPGLLWMAVELVRLHETGKPAAQRAAKEWSKNEAVEYLLRLAMPIYWDRQEKLGHPVPPAAPWPTAWPAAPWPTTAERRKPGGSRKPGGKRGDGSSKE